MSEWAYVSGEGEHMRGRTLLRPLMLVIVITLFVAACGSNAPTSGPVTIQTEADFSTRPVVGTFEVTEGADILECSDGTWEDTFNEATQDVSKLMTCSEPNTGTFTIVFDPDGYETGPGDLNGPWSILNGNDEFAGLSGEGDFWLVATGPETGVETFAGEIEYGS